MDLKKYLRDFPDFPKPGIIFKDISPILESPHAMKHIEDNIVDYFKDREIDLVAGAETRGLIFACSVATRLNKGLVMIRKHGKLPGPTLRISYNLEYGNATLEIQEGAVQPSQKVLLIDDILATGGTAKAASQLIEMSGGTVVGHAFILELAFLNGRKVLKDYDVQSLIVLDD